MQKQINIFNLSEDFQLEKNDIGIRMNQELDISQFCRHIGLLNPF